MPDFCQTMSSLEQVLKAYEQAGRILPSQYQCQPTRRSVAISLCDHAVTKPPGLKQPPGDSHPHRAQVAAGGSPTRMWVSGGARRSRTDDILLAKQALYQLSYGPVPGTVRAQENCQCEVHEVGASATSQQSW